MDVYVPTGAGEVHVPLPEATPREVAVNSLRAAIAALGASRSNGQLTHPDGLARSVIEMRVRAWHTDQAKYDQLAFRDQVNANLLARMTRRMWEPPLDAIMRLLFTGRAEGYPSASADRRARLWLQQLLGHAIGKHSAIECQPCALAIANDWQRLLTVCGCPERLVRNLHAEAVESGLASSLSEEVRIASLRRSHDDF